MARIETSLRGGALASAPRCLVLALVATGCTLEPVPIRLFDTRVGGVVPERELLPSIEEACDRLALECIADQGDSRGTVTLRVFDPPRGEIAGSTENTNPCRKAAWSIDHPLAISHELGHLFGLDHVDDVHNAMYPVHERAHDDCDFDDDQIEVVHRRAARFVAACNP